MITPAQSAAPDMAIRKVAGQGVLLLGGLGLSQFLAFTRNALLAWVLSRGEFGVAATLLLILQIVEVVSDIGTDRFMVQSQTAENPEVIAAAHTSLVVRGAILSILLASLAGVASRFFHIGEAASALTLLAIVPLLRGFQHLEARLDQRRLDNRAAVIVELVPQVAALIGCSVLLWLHPTYHAAAWAALLQAACAVTLSHRLARRPYRLGIDGIALSGLFTFGWPIWVGALTMIAVLQGDRIIIASLLGREALASYTIAFMVTMVPSLIAGRLGQGLLLPVLARAHASAEEFTHWYRLAVEGSTIVSAAKLVVLTMAGGELITVMFGASYGDLGHLAVIVGAMWAVRIAQIAPAIALTARGITRPLMVAGLVRASVLPLALLIATRSGSLADLAVAGLIGEIGALIVLAASMGDMPGRNLGAFAVRSACWLVPAALIGHQLRATGDLVAGLPAWSVLVMAFGFAGLLLTGAILARPELRTIAKLSLQRLRARHGSERRPALPS